MNRYLLGSKLRALSKEQKLSVEQLAELIGKSPRQVARYRSGTCKSIPIDVLEDLACALHTTVSVLVSTE